MDTFPISDGTQATAPDSITVVEAVGEHVLAKLVSLDGKGVPTVRLADPCVSFFRYEERPVNSIDDLAATLTELESSESKAVLRGRPTRVAMQARSARRLLHPRENEPATIERCPRRWLLLDIDDLPLPDTIDWQGDHQAAVSLAAGYLHECFQGVTCWYQFTGSMGFKPGLRLRLGFWLSRAVADQELKDWLGQKVDGAKELPLDTSVFYAASLIYTAGPVLGAGVEDPFRGRRSGVLTGPSSTVQVPEIAPRLASTKPKLKQDRSEVAGASFTNTLRRTKPKLRQKNWSGAVGASFTDALQLIGDHSGGDGFHDATKRAISAFWRENGSRGDPEQLRLLLAEQVRTADQSRHDNQYIATRLADLPRFIESIRALQAASEAASKVEFEGAECPYPEPGGALDAAEAELGQVIAAFFSTVVPEAVKSHDAFDTAILHYRVDRNTWKRRRREWSSRQEFSGGDDPFDDVFPEPEPEPPSQPIPGQWGVKVTPGVGKTRMAIEAVVREVANGGRFAFAVPNHDKAEEVSADLNKTAGGPIAMVWRGLSRTDSVSGIPMCRRNEEAKLVIAAAGKVEDLCGSSKRGFCPFHPAAGGACSYRQQALKSPPVWVVAHSTLRKAPPMSSRFDALILDERYALEAGGAETVTFADFQAIPPAGGGRRQSRHAAMVSKLAGAVLPVGELVRAESLLAADITAEDCRHARVAELIALQKPADAIRPARSDSYLEEAIAPIAARNAPLLRRARLFHLLAEFLDSNDAISGRLRRVADGFSLCQPIRIDSDWLNLPILHLDATLSAPIARNWLRGLEMKADIRVESDQGSVRVRQVLDPRVSYNKIVPSAGKDVAQHHTQERNLIRLFHQLELHAAAARCEGNKAVLAVLPKGAEDWIRRRYAGRIPANLLLMHFGALRGVNSAEDVSRVIVVSRPEPCARDLENLAMVLTGNGAISISEDGRYSKAPAALRMRDGSHVAIEYTTHPDPRCADLLRQIREAEVEQAFHRARPVRRSDGSPLSIEIVSPGVFDITVDETIVYADWLEEADACSVMLARGILPDDWGGVAALLSDRFATAEAARAHFKRAAPVNAFRRLALLAAKGGQTPIGESSYRELTGFRDTRGWQGYRYTIPGARKSHLVWVNLRQHGDPRAAWERWAGKVMMFEPLALPARAAALFDIALPPLGRTRAPGKGAQGIGADHRRADPAAAAAFSPTRSGESEAA